MNVPELDIPGLGHPNPQTGMPTLTYSRSWSNADLPDATTYIALVLSDPTTIDLAIVLSHFGVEEVLKVRDATEDERSFQQKATLAAMLEPAVAGVSLAA